MQFRKYALLACTITFTTILAPSAHAQITGAAIIGGDIFTGSQIIDPATGILMPNYDSAAPLYGAKVMVQNQHSGGAFITYGTVKGNHWTASVPAPGDYVVMFAAQNYDCTSREFTVNPGDVLTNNAYLPPLYTDPATGAPSTAPLPKANLLVYSFYDNYINSEDDAPDDPPLNGVTWTVRGEDGDILAVGITGTQPTITLSNGTVLTNTAGLYYFTDLPPGEVIATSDPSTVYLYDVNGPIPLPVINPTTGAHFDFDATTEFYGLTTEEGGHAWDPKLYPGDPGTELGGYLLWHGYVEILGQLPPSAGTGTIHGFMIDADPAFAVVALDEALIPALHPGVSGNSRISNGLVILYRFMEVFSIEPIATVEADPVTGEYQFDNVPPGNYKMFYTDLDLEYVWVQAQAAVAPGTTVEVDPWVPRFFARGQGFVYDNSTNPPTPMPGVDVHIRFKSGSIKKTTTTDANGWYNFETLPEIEVLGHVDVELPVGYRGAMITETYYPNATWTMDPNCPPTDLACVDLGTPYSLTHNAKNRYLQWYTANYQADLYIEPVPNSETFIDGYIFDEILRMGSWETNGVWEHEEERTMHGVTVELWNATLTQKLAETTTGKVDNGDLLAQGWHQPYTVPPDEWGGVFTGPEPGYYEFRTLDLDGDPNTPPTPLLPGTYNVKIIPGDPIKGLGGFMQSTPPIVPVKATGGTRQQVDFGVSTTPSGAAFGVPQAGEIEGGVFDDLFIDTNPNSTLFMEKAGLPGVPVGVYDHLGYFLGSGNMGHPFCYAGAPAGNCPPGLELVQKPELERRFAPGVHIYVGNDPSLPGYNPNYLPLVLPYQFGQGQYKFEADWSLVPVAFGGLGAHLDGSSEIDFSNAPIINSISPIAGGYLITGSNFGNDQLYTTVSLAGEELEATLWSDIMIQVDAPVSGHGGPMIVTSTAGPSNGMAVSAGVPAHSLFVDAAAPDGGTGSPGSPFNSIGDALANLPAAPAGTPRSIFVAPGSYLEQIQIDESDVRIIGAGPHETILDGIGAGPFIQQYYSSGAGPVVMIGAGGETGSVSNITISGLTIVRGTTNDDEIGGGIFGDYGNTNLDINNCIITQNGGLYGGGIWLHLSTHDVSIWSNTIAWNGNFGGYGGGISVNDEPEYGAEHGQPEHVWDDFLPGPPPGTYEIHNNHILNNFSMDYGGGVCIYENKDHQIIYGNLIEINKSDDHGGGAYFEETGPLDIYDNRFINNYCRDDGGAISFEDVGDLTAHINVFNNLFEGNIADDCGENHARGGALAFDDTFYATVFNNTITNNIVAGSIDPAGGGVDSERNGHEYNHDGEDGSYYMAPGFSDPYMFNNIISGNQRLNYDQPPSVPDGENLDYTWGLNYVWSDDNLHVDDPNLNGLWQTSNNSESLTRLVYNLIGGSEYTSRLGNIGGAPFFVDAVNGDYRLLPGSPGIDAGNNNAMPRDLMDLDHDGCTLERLPLDLAGNPRFADDSSSPNMGCGASSPSTAPIVDLGAYETQGIPAGSILYGDINGNGVINIDDLVAVLNAFGVCSGCCPADINGNGTINIDDLVGVLNVYGASCP